METAAMESVDVRLSGLSHNKVMMALVEQHYGCSIPDHQDLSVSWFSTSEDQLNNSDAAPIVRATPYPSVHVDPQWLYDSLDAGNNIFDTQILDINPGFPTLDPAYATLETENPMARPTNGNTQAHGPQQQGLVPEICLIPDSVASRSMSSGVSTPEPPLLTFNMSTPSDIDSFLSSSSNLPVFDDAASLFSDSHLYNFHGPITPVSLISSYRRQDELPMIIQEQSVVEFHTPSDHLQGLSDDAFAEQHEICQPPAQTMTMHNQGQFEVSASSPEPPKAVLEVVPKSIPSHTASSGPITKVWTLPKRIQRKTKPKSQTNNNGVTKPKPSEQPSAAATAQGSKPRTKRRGPYTDESKRLNTALTRVLKSCIRCRMNRGRCNPNPHHPSGPCLTCSQITGPTLSKMPCYRYIVTDASLYREQKHPSFSRRWSSMDIIDIPPCDWDTSSPSSSLPTSTITISVSPILVPEAPFSFRVRKFIPAEGDVVHEMWKTASGEMKQVALPRFAVAEMREAGETLRGYIERNVSKFIVGSVGGLDGLFWETYWMGFRGVRGARTPQERSLLTNVFRLWVVCRLTSNPVFISSGSEALGGTPIMDPESKYFGKVPMPKIMTAQFECIEYTNFLRPWSKAVLRELNELVLAKKREYWFTIYLAMFVLLHSCSMVTRRDRETAGKWGMRTKYANPTAIAAHHAGAQTMLAHFHFINKGVLPFHIPLDEEKGRQELAKAAALTEEQLDFVRRTGEMIRDPGRVARMKHVRDNFDVGDDFYWISMLYDREWKPVGND
ncbi:hypothetical protein B0T20DRAFT_457152 [Sordaria brevicollis]|uniref:Zn(2)-C6 fungal-type domain-containing protein n=1 Tax=Sordaria brevicollis TaxID=83679 RepID=A0AAE0NVQ5_SORBR|nr:hypothetical protein B0T20DRAFT_457152 [Sordaria brevicollis]